MDEAAIGYNAISILKTGRDEFNKPFPLVFRSFDDYKLPVYIYLVSISQLLLGENILTVRLPSAISGTLTVFVLILLVDKLFKNKKLSLLSGLFLSVSPWSMHFSRGGFEANASLFFTTAGIYFLITGLSKNRHLFLSMAFFLISLFTYHSARVFIPLFLFGVFILERKRVFEILRKKFIYIAACFILCLPLIYTILSPQSLIRAKSVSFTREIKANPEIYIQNKTILTADQFLKNYFSNFSTEYLFFLGDGNGRHGVREIGQLYLWQIPFLIYGIYLAFEKKKRAIIFIIWLLAAPVGAALAIPNPHAIRTLRMAVPFSFFTALGIYRLFSAKRRSFTGVIFAYLFFAYFLFSYLHIYFVHYPKRTSPDWSGGTKEAIEYALSKSDKYEKIFITDKMEFGYIFLFYYGKFDPEKVNNAPDNHKEYGKYRFVSSPFSEKHEGNVLYISPFWENWDGKLLTEIKNKGGDGAYKIWEN